MKYIILIFVCSMAFAQDDIFDKCNNPECHATEMSKEVVHSAIEDGCDTCHELNGEGEHPLSEGEEFILTSEREELCLDCHDIGEEGAIMHDPVESGDCIACHNPHSSSNEYLLKAEVDARLCEGCHDLDYWQNKKSHGPVAAGKCLVCHQPHYSKNNMLLIKSSQNLCFSCHEELKEFSHKKNIHKPFKLNCLSCHDSHGGTQNAILKSNMPDVCYKCHENIKLRIENNDHVHSATSESNKCANCHNPHASDFNNLILDENFDTCLRCHNKEINTEDRTISNIKKTLTESNLIHSPVEDGCSSCHDPHAAENMFLLGTGFGEKFYNESKSQSEFCFECHDDGIINSENSSDATEFRNGSENLHFIHMSKGKSRNCTVCHNVHASQNERLILKFSQFGNWKMPMNFEITEEGGSCLPGCHEKLSYSRD